MEIDFLPIFYPIFQDLCHFLQLWQITPVFYTNFFGFGRLCRQRLRQAIYREERYGLILCEFLYIRSTSFSITFHLYPFFGFS